MPALADLGLAIVLFLVACGLYIVYRLCQYISGYVSIFGWHPLDVIAQWLHDAITWIMHLDIAALKQLTSFLDWLVNTQLSWGAEVVAGVFHLFQNDKHIVTTTIPHATAQQQAHTSQAVHGEAVVRQSQVNTLHGEVNDLTHGLTAVSVFAHDTLPADFHAYTDQKTQAAIATADADARNMVNSLQSEIEQELAGVNSQLTELQKLATSTLPADIAKQAQIAAAEVNAAKASLISDLDAEATTEQQALSSGLATIQGQVSIDGAQIGSLDQAVGITIPAAIGAVAASVAAVTTEVDNCMVSACGGPHSLENELQNLAGLFATTGELSFLGAAIKDPQGTAETMDAIIGPWLQSGKDLFDELLSL